MIEKYTFQWRAPNGGEPDRWLPDLKGKPYLTQVRAEGAALRWMAIMKDKGCPIECQVGELVDDGRNGKKFSFLFDVLGCD